mgnify:CR=1 FL=1
MDQKEIKSIAKRTERYWFDDGIWEIGFGLVNMLLAGFYAAADSINPGSGWLLLPLQMVVIIGAFLGMRRLILFLKERITYPRTGYVAYRKPAPAARIKRMVVSGLVAAAMALIMAAAASLELMRNTTALVASIMLAGALVYIGYRFNLTRSYIQAGLTIGIGFIFSLLSLPDMQITAGFFAAFGLLLVISGLATLAVYLARSRSDRESASEPDEEPKE